MDFKYVKESVIKISAICVSSYKIFSNYRNIVFEIDVFVWTN